jgi:hypothetical protein
VSHSSVIKVNIIFRSKILLFEGDFFTVSFSRRVLLLGFGGGRKLSTQLCLM